MAVCQGGHGSDSQAPIPATPLAGRERADKPYNAVAANSEKSKLKKEIVSLNDEIKSLLKRIKSTEEGIYNLILSRKPNTGYLKYKNSVKNFTLLILNFYFSKTSKRPNEKQITIKVNCQRVIK